MTKFKRILGFLLLFGFVFGSLFIIQQRDGWLGLIISLVVFSIGFGVIKFIEWLIDG